MEYAVLSSNYVLEGVYSFLAPVTVIEGVKQNNQFVTDLGENFEILDSINETYLDSDSFVTSIITEEELQSLFNGSKKDYYDTYKKHVYFRKYLENNMLSKVFKLSCDLVDEYLNNKISERNKVIDLLGEELSDILFDIVNYSDDYKNTDIEEFDGSICELNMFLNHKINFELPLKKSLIILNKISTDLTLTIDNLYRDKQNTALENEKFDHIYEVLSNLSNYMELISSATDEDDLKNYINSYDEDDFFDINKGVEVEYVSDTDKNVKEEADFRDSILSDDSNILKVIRDCKDHLDKYVIGQEVAKRNAIMALVKNQLISNKKHRLGCLFYGSTGTGKTFIPEVLCDYLKIPYFVFDITQVSAPGYVGENLETCLYHLYEKAGRDIKKAQKGVIVFDEIDKKLINSSENSVSGKSVIHQMLKFAEGTVYDINSGKSGCPPLYFDTSELTIFYTGAFQSLIDELGKKDKFVGFNTSDKLEKKSYSILELCEKARVPKELGGRIGYFTMLDKLSKDVILEIINNAEDNSYTNSLNIFKKMGINFSIDDSFLPAVAQGVCDSGLGARSLNNIVNSCLDTASEEVLFSDGANNAILNEELVQRVTSISKDSKDKSLIKK